MYYDFFKRKFLENFLVRKVVTEVSPTSGIMNFPFKGTLVNAELYFRYETQCENDHFATLISPSGLRIIVMNRGLNRCSGSPETYYSQNSDIARAFIGSEANGDWNFVMTDLDRNKFTGTLEEVWLKIAVNDHGKMSDHKINLQGLPSAIPPAL